MAKGLDGRKLRAHWGAIDAAARRIKGIRVFKGVEVDILEDGGRDLSQAVLGDADWVIASIHYGQNQSKRHQTTAQRKSASPRSRHRPSDGPLAQ